MERMSCPTRGCGAIYPDYARFCPRCGNANPRVMSSFDRSRPPQVTRVGSEAKKSSGWRGNPRAAFRLMGLLFFIPWLIIGKINSHNRHVQAQFSPATPITAATYRPTNYPYHAYQQPASVPVADVSTLTAFETQLAIGFVSDDARDQWRQQIVGQRVHWTGYVFTPNDGIGAPALASSVDRAAPALHLQTATRGAKNQLRGIPDGSKVQIDGVLMDDHWIHVIDVSRTW